MKAIHSDKEYAVDRFLDLWSKIPEGRLLWFRANEWNMPYNIGPNKDLAKTLYKQAYKDQKILDTYDLEEWNFDDLDEEEYVIAFRSPEQIGIVSIEYEMGEVAERLESLFNTIIIDRPKQLDNVLSSKNSLKKKVDDLDIPQLIDWHEI